MWKENGEEGGGEDEAKAEEKEWSCTNYNITCGGEATFKIDILSPTKSSTHLCPIVE